jgi:hypothetical protein
MRSSPTSWQAVKSDANITGNWMLTSYRDVPGAPRGVVRGAGLLVCECWPTVIGNSPPAWTVFLRWVIDGIPPQSTDMHMTYSVVAQNAVIGPYPVRAAMYVGPGDHSVGLQARSDVNNPQTTIRADATSPLVLTARIT